MEGDASPLVQQMALTMLAAWAEASVVNCGKIATMGAGGALRRAAEATPSEGDAERKQLAVLRVMTALAADCPLRCAEFSCSCMYLCVCARGKEGGEGRSEEECARERLWVSMCLCVCVCL